MDDNTTQAIQAAVDDLVAAGTVGDEKLSAEKVKSAMAKLTAVAQTNEHVQEALSDIFEAAEGGDDADGYLERGMVRLQESTQPLLARAYGIDEDGQRVLVHHGGPGLLAKLGLEPDEIVSLRPEQPDPAPSAAHRLHELTSTAAVTATKAAAIEEMRDCFFGPAAA